MNSFIWIEDTIFNLQNLEKATLTSKDGQDKVTLYLANSDLVVAGDRATRLWDFLCNKAYELQTYEEEEAENELEDEE